MYWSRRMSSNLFCNINTIYHRNGQEKVTLKEFYICLHTLSLAANCTGKKLTRGRKLSSSKPYLETDLKKVGFMARKYTPSPSPPIFTIQWSSLISVIVNWTVNINSKSILVMTVDTENFGMSNITSALRLNTGMGTQVWNTG